MDKVFLLCLLFFALSCSIGYKGNTPKADEVVEAEYHEVLLEKDNEVLQGEKVKGKEKHVASFEYQFWN